MKHEARARRKFRNAIEMASARTNTPLPAALFLTDPARTPDIIATTTQLPEGVGVLLRHFGRPDQIAIAAELAATCREQGRTLLVSADPALCEEIHADGVHWPGRLVRAGDWKPASGKLQTMSVHRAEDLNLAERTGMDAVLVSPVFASDSPSATNPIGLARLQDYTENTTLQVYGLGGIDAENAERVAAICGFASVSGFSEVYRPRT